VNQDIDPWNPAMAGLQVWQVRDAGHKSVGPDYLIVITQSPFWKSPTRGFSVQDVVLNFHHFKFGSIADPN